MDKVGFFPNHWNKRSSGRLRYARAEGAPASTRGSIRDPATAHFISLAPGESWGMWVLLSGALGGAHLTANRTLSCLSPPLRLFRDYHASPDMGKEACDSTVGMGVGISTASYSLMVRFSPYADECRKMRQIDSH